MTDGVCDSCGKSVRFLTLMRMDEDLGVNIRACNRCYYEILEAKKTVKQFHLNLKSRGTIKLTMWEL